MGYEHITGKSIVLSDISNEQLFLPKVGFWKYFADEDKLIFSEKFSQMAGVDKEVMTLQEFKDLIIKQDQNVFEEFMNTLFAEKSYLGAEFRIRASAGHGAKAKWINCYGEYKNGAASSAHYAGFFFNITARKRKEQKLSISNSNFEKIEDISRMGSFNWIISEDYLLCSDNFFNLAKLKNTHPENKLEKSEFYDLISKDSKKFVADVVQEGISSKQRFEVSFTLAKHPKVKLQLFGYPLEGEYENKFFGLLKDVSYSADGRNSLIEGQDTERKRISLELHDSVGQKLIAVKYKLTLMKMTQDLKGLEYVNKSIDEIIDEVRTITHNLSSQIVSEVGLKEAINQILTETAAALSANKHLAYDVEKGRLNVDTEKMIYRIIQESLSNALKHSKARNLNVNLNIINHQVSIEVLDDGVGFDSDSNVNRGIGLQNIKERVTFLNGYFKLISKKGNGTSIRVKIPLPDNEH